MITRKQFCEVLERIRRQDQRVVLFSDALEAMCDSWVVFDSDNGYRHAALSMLEWMLNDHPEDSLIGGWLDGDFDGKLYGPDGESLLVHIKTDGELYDYMISTEAAYK